ncbi:MAG: metallophosphoesterase [Bacillota bacterium]|nr:metallophosphoesterase [Bacillota bacterium]HOB92319.1 metallophosphoesterase [Bacillota bacterium]HPZ55395.1 metallophosphoesterase [Bacillota bacterium]HQD18781.1 metallophosphoesterase [Bacillota bacterium]
MRMHSGVWSLRRVLMLSLLILIVVLASTTGPFASFGKAAVYPQTRFAVISDPHVFDVSLGTEGPVFQEHLISDRKLLIQSRELLEAAVSELCNEDLDFVIVAGDLTKDGERINHELCASILSRLIESGIAVYVVPGNHDILNGYAMSFTSTGASPVASVTPEEFAEIYAKMGYEQAIVRDSASLSYVVEPVPGLWLVAMDACRYRENAPEATSVVGGRFSEDTLKWLDSVMNLATSSGKALLGVMHHGVVEHYKGQQRFFGDFLVEDWKLIAERFAASGMKVVFTGHYHAQDITKAAFTTDIGGKKRNVFIFDVETGALVTYPCPYRVVEITEDQVMHIRSHFIAEIPSHPAGFQEYAKEYVHSGLTRIAYETLRKYRVNERSAEILAPQVADAFIAHYSGDEVTPKVTIDTSGTALWAKLVVWVQRGLINGLWNDLEPADNDIDIDLSTGSWTVPSN